MTSLTPLTLKGELPRVGHWESAVGRDDRASLDSRPVPLGSSDLAGTELTELREQMQLYVCQSVFGVVSSRESREVKMGNGHALREGRERACAVSGRACAQPFRTSGLGGHALPGLRSLAPLRPASLTPTGRNSTRSTTGMRAFRTPRRACALSDRPGGHAPFPDTDGHALPRSTRGARSTLSCHSRAIRDFNSSTTAPRPASELHRPAYHAEPRQTPSRSRLHRRGRPAESRGSLASPPAADKRGWT